MYISFLRSKKLARVSVGILLVVSVLSYLIFFRSTDTATTTTSVIVEQVSKGDVTNGIQTTGKIEAAEILDLNVYKLTNRIDMVNVVNGSHVEAGDLLFAFDQSDVVVDITASRISVREAQLSLEQQREGVEDPNTTITTLKNDIAKLEEDLSQYETDKRTALRDLLNSDLEAVPSTARYSEQVDEQKPTIGGLYTSVEQGEYVIRVYASGEGSGYSYRLSGLETGVYPVYLGAETKLGARGLTITFPSTGITSRDEWVIKVPNTGAYNYSKNLEDYNDRITSIEQSIKTDTVSLANKKVQLAQAQRGDTTEQRNLGVESAALAIEKARVDLQKNIDTRNERQIIAPFAGTVEGVENVVVGATPTKDSNDSIDLGSLISDEFLATFSLGASDVSKIEVGQKVLVTLTSLPQHAPLEAKITEISSLPDSSTVAQYEVAAKITDPNASSTLLRDGMLADIEIVQQEKTDVVRVPTSAISYSDRSAQITIIEGLSEQQYKQMQSMGIVRSEGTPTYTTYKRNVELGLSGQYYVEILSGLEQGELIVVTNSVTSEDTSTVVNTRFGPGGGGRPPSDSDRSGESGGGGK